MTQARHTPVAIIGGGPVGLAFALEMTYQGIDCTLIERKPGVDSELLAKAGTLSARTMEFCRRWGIAERVANWGADPDYPRDTVYLTALHGGHVIGRDKVPSARQRKEPFSPEMLRKCPQHVFDPVLAQAVVEGGRTSLLYGRECVALEPDSGGVTVQVTDVETGAPSTLRADYVVVCDGAGSRLRGELGIPFEGRHLDYSMGAMVKIKDLHEYHDIGKATRYLFMDETGTWAVLTSVDYGELWRFTLQGSDEKLSPETVDIDAQFRRALGRDDVPFEMMRAMPWWRTQYVAGDYHRGRVLIAGDAAHTMSPTGGHGLNTGMGDVVGLGWMIAALLAGWGGPRLLDAYTAERRPVAIRNGSSSSRNYETWMGAGMALDHLDDSDEQGERQRSALAAVMSERLREEWFADGVRMGYRYEHSPLVVADDAPEPPDSLVEYLPTARPGHRAPHIWLEDNASILDLFGPGFTLLRLGPTAPDAATLQDGARQRGLPLAVVSIERDDVAKLYERALVLVRPDGHVAWWSDVPPGQDEALSIIDQVRGAA